MPATDIFVASTLLDPPVCFLACDDPGALVVSCPLLGAASDDDSAEAGPCAGLSLCSLLALADGSRYNLVAAALAHTGTFVHHGAATITVNATRAVPTCCAGPRAAPCRRRFIRARGRRSCSTPRPSTHSSGSSSAARSRYPSSCGRRTAPSATCASGPTAPAHRTPLRCRTASKGGRPTSPTRGCSSFLFLSSMAMCRRRTTSLSATVRRRSRRLHTARATSSPASSASSRRRGSASRFAPTLPTSRPWRTPPPAARTDVRQTCS